MVVARVLADGPMAMGPFVYLTEPGLEVTTLLCRCMPAQVDDFFANTYYELIENGSPGELLPSNVNPPPERELPLRLPGAW